MKFDTCSCFLRRDKRGNERWQKLQLNGTERAELAAKAALESPLAPAPLPPLLLLLLLGGVDRTTWPSVGGILSICFWTCCRRKSVFFFFKERQFTNQSTLHSTFHLIFKN
jgi:hypothetical protein